MKYLLLQLVSMDRFGVFFVVCLFFLQAVGQAENHKRFK